MRFVHFGQKTDVPSGCCVKSCPAAQNLPFQAKNAVCFRSGQPNPWFPCPEHEILCPHHGKHSLPGFRAIKPMGLDAHITESRARNTENASAGTVNPRPFCAKSDRKAKTAAGTANPWYGCPYHGNPRTKYRKRLRRHGKFPPFLRKIRPESENGSRHCRQT